MEGMICSFTGHREIPEEDRARVADLLHRAVAFAYDEGCRVFAAGGAVGFDTMAEREVVRFRLTHPDVKLLLLLPCPEQADKWDDFRRGAYDHLISEADEVRFVCETYTKTCMRERNAALASICEILIAYVVRPRSGAAQTVRMAQAAGKRVYNLAPKTAGER